MQRRDQIGLMVGIAVAIGSCALLTQAGIGAGAVLIVVLLFCPLVVATVAAKRLFLLALVPNILIACFFSIVGALSPYNQAPGGGLSDESLFLIPIVFVISGASALLMSGAVWFVRKEIMGG
jgi:hypothetical protein